MSDTDRLPPELLFDLVRPEEVKTAHDLEVEAFPPNEAATLEQFSSRQAQASSLFLGAFTPSRSLVGYICATRSSASSLTHASMSTHEANGSSVCIHAIVVSEVYQRRGVALALLREYIHRIREAEQEGYECVLLICHEELRTLYENAGFTYVGPSEVVHGSKPWIELRLDLKPAQRQSEQREAQSLPDELTQSEPLPPHILAALQSYSSAASSSRPALAKKLLPANAEGLDAVTSEGSNKVDLLCPRESCRSVILSAGVGSLVEVPLIRLEPEGSNPPPMLSILPESGSQTSCWLVQPNPMAFENISYSREVSLAPSDGSKVKLLSCADCDIGPLGWAIPGGSSNWLVCTRVAYRT